MRLADRLRPSFGKEWMPSMAPGRGHLAAMSLAPGRGHLAATVAPGDHLAAMAFRVASVDGKAKATLGGQGLPGARNHPQALMAAWVAALREAPGVKEATE